MPTTSDLEQELDEIKTAVRRMPSVELFELIFARSLCALLMGSTTLYFVLR